MPNYFCYLIRSESKPNSCYIGFTTNPQRRLRQHNGEIKNGAVKTKRNRPWKFEIIISGFPNHVVALMFEWQFQHPLKSRHGKVLEGSLSKKRSSVHSFKGHLVSLSLLLRNQLWKQCDLTALFINQTSLDLFMQVSSKSSSPFSYSFPVKLILNEDICKLHEKVKGNKNVQNNNTNSEIDNHVTHLNGRCCICFDQIVDNNSCYFQCPNCNASIHILCLAQRQKSSQLIPSSGQCTGCKTVYIWADIVRNCKYTSPNRNVSEGNDNFTCDGSTNDCLEVGSIISVNDYGYNNEAESEEAEFLIPSQIIELDGDNLFEMDWDITDTVSVKHKQLPVTDTEYNHHEDDCYTYALNHYDDQNQDIYVIPNES